MVTVHTLAPVDGDSRETVAVKFDTIIGLRAWLEVAAPSVSQASLYTRSQDAFHGFMSWQSAMQAMCAGDSEHVALARSFADEVRGLVDWTSRKFEVRKSVSGAGSLDVSAYAAGLPRMIRRRVRVEDDAAPLHIVVAVNSASNVTTRQLVRRGAAIAALVDVLSADRPVTLWASAVGKAYPCNAAFAVRLETSPISIAQVAFVLADPNFGRKIGFAARAAIDEGRARGTDYPAVGDSGDGKAVGGRIMARLIGCPVEDTVYLPRPAGNDKLLDKPKEWLADMLKTYGRLGEAG